MQLKTIQQIVEEKVPSGTEHGWWLDDYTDDLLTQDRADIRAVLKAALDELDAPMSSDPYCDSYSGYGRAITDAMLVIDTLLPGDVSK